MSTENNTESTPVTLAEMLKASGFTMKSGKSRLTYGSDVANVFTDAKVQDVIVIGTEATDDYVEKLAKMADSFAGLVILRGTDSTASIKAHLARIGKTRNVAWTDKSMSTAQGVPEGDVNNVDMAVHVTRKGA
ncbi:MAG TPA: hypothetical protein VGE97_09365 [Nitrososphaera sp.]|jgi:hypothetical protein